MAENGRKKWKLLWIDQRKISRCLVGSSLVAGVVAWMLVSLAVAQTVPERVDAPVRVSDLVRFQWWAIAGLLGLVQILVGFVVIRDMNSTKSNVRDLWHEKLSTEAHNQIDHSLLCAKCRSEKK